jgi:hypothetical protein
MAGNGTLQLILVKKGNYMYEVIGTLNLSVKR